MMLRYKDGAAFDPEAAAQEVRNLWRGKKFNLHIEELRSTPKPLPKRYEVYGEIKNSICT